MPEPDYVWLPREHILSFEEIGALVGIFIRLGVDRLRLTGGEPLLRKGLPDLVRLLAGTPGLRDIALTTNGIGLAGEAAPLREAGLHRVTVSLDTLRPERFRALTGQDRHAEVIEGIEAASRAGFSGLKINMLVIRGVNEDEIAGLIGFGKRVGAEVRLIEYMDIGGATLWSAGQVVSKAEMLGALAKRYGPAVPVVSEKSAPADRFVLPDGTRFGIISSTTAPFCRDCDRSRLTADGLWYLCLYAREGIDLRKWIRSRAPEEEIRAAIARAWRDRRDRGAEERMRLAGRGPLYPNAELKRDPHLEMHTRGG
jgi:cyclic pyranopterin phosphate synthase